MVCLLAERYDNKSNVKLAWFWSQLQVSYVSSHTEELWYDETVCLWMTYIYIYIYIYIYKSNVFRVLVSLAQDCNCRAPSEDWTNLISDFTSFIYNDDRLTTRM